MNEVTTAQMKELERLADAAGLPYLRMMENAGTAAAWPRASRPHRTPPPIGKPRRTGACIYRRWTA